eukprot:CAMPEP_0195015510 /NCGR_PEP_ID=MMETSP0326_2-20130528/20067_1 /TAXON_ID=2866 ORGANISM="Crypthecodinium cohnii, Strain Seligo" /NCGR_SAMPLE_ID=MMETSP0326_2 /ASSEMBLY_ACC=CAM_ASM_000348 /LENGTH=119 /DNA_ID=CAMNT_0040029899 /DNA_START=16 /DNA_END=375 /DNA_ORIENTATION=-
MTLLLFQGGGGSGMEDIERLGEIPRRARLAAMRLQSACHSSTATSPLVVDRSRKLSAAASSARNSAGTGHAPLWFHPLNSLRSRGPSSPQRFVQTLGAEQQPMYWPCTFGAGAKADTRR